MSCIDTAYIIKFLVRKAMKFLVRKDTCYGLTMTHIYGHSQDLHIVISVMTFKNHNHADHQNTTEPMVRCNGNSLYVGVLLLISFKKYNPVNIAYLNDNLNVDFIHVVKNLILVLLE